MNPKKVLIYRPDNIGDVILFSGTLKHIRDLYHHSHITLAVQSHIINLVELCPFVDKVISSDKFSWLVKLQEKKIKGTYRFRNQIEYIENLIKKIFPITDYDLVICPVKSPTSKQLKILNSFRCEKLVGIGGCNLNLPNHIFLKPESLFSAYLDVSNENPWRHELFTTLDFLNFLGANATDINDIKPLVWLDDSDKIFFNTLNLKKPIIGLFPGASSDIRIWPLNNYSILAKRIPSLPSIVILGSKKEAEMADLIKTGICTERKNAEVINLAGKTTLRQLYAVIRNLSLLISMETSALHFGVTSGIPTIGIAGGGHFGRFVPWGSPVKNLILTNQLNCFHCNWHCSRETVKCIEGVTVEAVLAAIQKLTPSFF
jgi:ADP-heptose:LPS heptosyltransferase